MTTTPTPIVDAMPTLPPTAVPCPDWCQLPAGHPYEVEDELGHPGRFHSARAAAERGPSEAPFAGVTAVAYYIGGREVIAPLVIDVVINGNQCESSVTSASEARNLADELLRAAEQMEAIQ